jgi:methylase of polypeptide subunit release factors
VDPLSQLRSALAAADYSAGTIAERLGLDITLNIRRDDVPVHLRRLQRGDALDALIGFFLLQSDLGVDEAEAVLKPAGLDDLEELGLLRRDGPTVHPLLRLTPHAGLLIAHDTHLPGDLRRDSVLGLTSSARTLASMTVRDPVNRVLDLGTGCGVQALLAAGHAKEVVAVDLNPRALWLTAMSCRLNGIDNVDCRTGDLFEPVRGETFDLVVTNPPFVISPSSDYLFRDSGLEEDGLARAVVTGAAEVLSEGGFAHVMCNWVARKDDPWSTAVESWIAGLGCDALILHYDTLEPLPYAAAWNDGVATGADRLSATLDSWLEYYRERGIEAIGMGAVILRRRTGAPNWVKTAELARGPSGAAGAQVRRLFAAQDALAAIGDDKALLDWSFAAVDGHRLQQTLTFKGGGYTTEDAVILLDDGLGLRNGIPAQALHVLLRLNGSSTLRDIVLGTAEDTGLDVEELSNSAATCVRDLFALGLLDLYR